MTDEMDRPELNGDMLADRQAVGTMVEAIVDLTGGIAEILLDEGEAGAARETLRKMRATLWRVVEEDMDWADGMSQEEFLLTWMD